MMEFYDETMNVVNRFNSAPIQKVLFYKLRRWIKSRPSYKSPKPGDVVLFFVPGEETIMTPSGIPTSIGTIKKGKLTKYVDHRNFARIWDFNTDEVAAITSSQMFTLLNKGDLSRAYYKPKALKRKRRMI